MANRDPRPVDLLPWTSGIVRALAARLFDAQGVPGGVPSGGQDAIVVVIDVVGFTARAARHAQRGVAGIESIADEVNACFGLLAERAEHAGGDVLRFVGDAMIVGFPVTAGAARAALSLAGGASTLPEGPTQLTLRAGVALGALEWVVTGGVGGRFDVLFHGAAVRRAHELAANGASGVAACPAVLLLAEQSGEAFDRAAPTETCEATARFVSPGLLASLRAGAGAWLAEVRPATVLMVRLFGPDDEVDPDGVSQAVAAVMASVSRVGGWFDKVVADDKGVFVLATTGLPRHEDDARRAIVAALEIEGRLLTLGLRPSIGVASGPVVWGPVGSASRREYTVIGAPVNTAARLMSAARRGVVCDAATVGRVARPSAFRLLGTRLLRGLGEVQMYRPLLDAWTGPSSALRHQGAMLGRREQAEMVRTRLTRAPEAGGRLVVVGEAGAGKSRLVSWAVEQAVSLGYAAFTCRSDAIPSGRLLAGWTEILHAALGQPPDLRPAVVERFGDLAPIVATAFNVSMLDNTRTRALDATARRDLLVEAVSDLVLGRADASPRLLVLEDAHWMDDLSWAVLDRVLERAPGRAVVVIATMRPDGAESERVAALAARLGADATVLGPLGEADVALLAARRLGATPSPTLRGFLTDRARGNPFFSEETAVALRDGGLVSVIDGVAHLVDQPTGMPESVADLVATRFDRLPLDVSLTLKIAAVIGEEIDPRLVSACHPAQPTVDAVVVQLGVAAQAGLVVRVDGGGEHAEGPEPSDELGRDTPWRFRHALHREVGCATMVSEQRRRVHGAVARELTRQPGPTPPARLLFHWREAGEPSRAVGLVEPAASAALGVGAWREAADLLRYGMSIAGLPDETVTRWSAWLGTALVALGAHREAQDRLEVALRGLGAPVPTSNLGLVAASLSELGRQGVHRAGWVRVDPADQKRAAEAASAYEQLGYVYYARCNTLAGVHAALRLLNLAELAGPSVLLARAYAAMSLTASVIPAPRMAAFYEGRGFAVAEAIDDEHARAYVAWLAAVRATGDARWSDADDHGRRAVACALEGGDHRLWAMVAESMAFGALAQGDLVRAEAVSSELAEKAESRRMDVWRVWGLAGWSEALLASGRFEEAEARGAEAAAILSRDPDRSEEMRVLGIRALGAWAVGRHGEALQWARAAAALGRQLDLTTFVTWSGFRGAAEVLSAAAEAGLARPEEAVAAQRALSSFHRVFPVGRTLAGSPMAGRRAAPARSAAA